MTTTLEEKIKAAPFWYHKIELPGGITTPGWAPLNVEVYDLPEDLTGKRVLDVGAWDGFWTFESLKRGAEYVMAIDDLSDPGDCENDDVPHTWENFDLCAEALGYDETRFKRVTMSLYDLRPWQHGMFDYVLFFGVLYHCRYPLLALDTLVQMMKPEGTMLVETALLDDCSIYRGGIGNGYRGEQVVMEFYPTNELGGVYTNWWSPTLRCLGHMMTAAGLKEVKGRNLTDHPQDLATCRGYAKGVRA